MEKGTDQITFVLRFEYIIYPFCATQYPKYTAEEKTNKRKRLHNI